MLKGFHNHIVRWSTMNNISQRSITRSVAFTEMMDYAIEKAATLSRCTPVERKLAVTSGLTLFAARFSSRR